MTAGGPPCAHTREGSRLAVALLAGFVVTGCSRSIERGRMVGIRIDHTKARRHVDVEQPNLLVMQ
jgi:hypothetical protein